MKLTQARVKELFDYRADGELIRKVNKSGGATAGDVAGSINKVGYKVTRVDWALYLNHRLVWLWHFGYFPEHDLDHIDRNRLNNRVENLREVNQTCNMRNAKLFNNNSSGITGVYWYKPGNKWSAKISVAYKNVHLGYFQTKLEAAQARWKAEVKYGFPNCNTTSTAYQYVTNSR
jgi:hypothetical protein